MYKIPKKTITSIERNESRGGKTDEIKQFWTDVREIKREYHGEINELIKENLTARIKSLWRVRGRTYTKQANC